MTHNADGSVVLTQLQVAFLWMCENKGLSPCGRSFPCLPNLVADYKIPPMIQSDGTIFEDIYCFFPYFVLSHLVCTK